MSGACPDAPAAAGPFLIARGSDEVSARLSAVVATPAGETPPALEPEDGEAVAARELGTLSGRTLWVYDFSLPVKEAACYRIGGREWPVATDLTEDVRIAFVACNGRENGDLQDDPAERNALWADLAEKHARRPVHLMLQGGDQVYADDVWQSHPDLDAWEQAGEHKRAAMPLTDEAAEAAQRFYLDRCLTVFCQPETAWLMARVPSLMMWDDHDIFDGWGSHKESSLDSPIGRGVFEAARRVFRMLQLGMPAEGPETTLSWTAEFPRLGVIAPDLRSERRPHMVMGDDGWRAFEAGLDALADKERLIVVSTVPALGPRLSLLESFIGKVPHAAKYEDDLRDQWQSRYHRAEWRRFLQALVDRVEAGQGVSVVSGEIHLATQGVLQVDDRRVIRQLVASGIAHPAPPRAWAWFLGQLARLGETPLAKHPIRLLPLPGHGSIYKAERNYLMLDRAANSWTACWRLDKSGWTPPVEL